MTPAGPLGHLSDESSHEDEQQTPKLKEPNEDTAEDSFHDCLTGLPKHHPHLPGYSLTRQADDLAELAADNTLRPTVPPPRSPS